jgi:hypothetical protein
LSGERPKIAGEPLYLVGKRRSDRVAALVLVLNACGGAVGWDAYVTLRTKLAVLEDRRSDTSELLASIKELRTETAAGFRELREAVAAKQDKRR